MSELMSREDLARIEAKIADVERHTAGEIVVHVVDRSDDYPAPRLLWAVLAAAVGAEAASVQLGGVWQAWTVEIAAVLAVGLWFLFGVPAILRGMVPAATLRSAVHRRALAAFVENRVFRTRDASGVLILLSVLERRVEILADEGIHARVGVEQWQAHVGRIVEGVRRGAPADGIIDCVERIGGELADGIPIRADDTNELSNEVVVSER